MEARFTPSVLSHLIADALTAGGMLSETATIVADHLVDSECNGVKSHGVNRLGYYLTQIDAGSFDPKAKPEVMENSSTVTRINGNGGIGIPAMALALEHVLVNARSSGIAMAGVENVGHTGRMGAYVEEAARQGFFAQTIGGGGSKIWGNVVPYGGMKPMLSTNPYSFGMPGGNGPPIISDFAISTVSTGTIRVAKVNNSPLPPRALMDKNGNPTTNPHDYDAGGALLPAGDHKGSGLGMVAELMGRAMLKTVTEFNWLVIAIPADVFTDTEHYEAAVNEMRENVHTMAPAPGFDQVLMPGEPEAISAEGVARNGVPLSASIWQGIVEAAGRVGVNPSNYDGLEFNPERAPKL